MTAPAKLHTLNVVAAHDGVVEGTAQPFIPPGEYVAVFHHYETMKMFKTPKLFMHFEIVDIGPYCGTKLYAPFRVAGLIGKEGRNGRFKLGIRSELFLTLCRLQPKVIRPDRISLRGFKGPLFKIRVRTVDKDYRQRPLPEFLKYSVVDAILSVEAGNIE